MAVMETLEINKKLLPYEFSILLAGELFTLHISYNATGEFFTVDLYKGGELICAGEPIVYGVPLWKDVYQAGKYPALDIIPRDPSGERNAVTFDNLGDTVLLIVDNGEVTSDG